MIKIQIKKDFLQYQKNKNFEKKKIQILKENFPGRIILFEHNYFKFQKQFFIIRLYHNYHHKFLSS